MAQEKKAEEIIITASTSHKEPTNPSFKFNAHAPEFVPRSLPQMPVSGYFYPYLQFLGNGVGDWIYFAEQDPSSFVAGSHARTAASTKSNNDVVQKIVKQVEYQFSDTNLIASDFLMKIMNKDPEGYVPMSVIASWKKIKSLGINHQMLIKALRTSTKLIVSDDGKKVRRKQLFTERDKEELQSRTVIVENLPEDYTRQSLEKMFNVVGSVKNVRICHPQDPNTARSSKSDVLISNKLHALVEFESADQAEKAVEKLNDERNWRKGLRVRAMLRRTPRSVIKGQRFDYDHFDVNTEDEQSPPSHQSLSSPRHIDQLLEETIVNQTLTQSYDLLSHNGRGILSQAPQSGASLGIQLESIGKQTPQGPRMPDGTRGFTMGRDLLEKSTCPATLEG
ncbi:La-related protein 7 [Dioscorea alata]|uniref:La-related protein 7 n=1 Tax=Dioscorea alata TaxID=55571 RepID=A0ACB7UNU6_DIOAL|nr:La-related protein 7 [Dioscorea alata]